MFDSSRSKVQGLRATYPSAVARPLASTGVIGVGLANTTPGTVTRTVLVVEGVYKIPGMNTEVL